MAAANFILTMQIVLGLAMLAVIVVSRFGSQPLKNRLANFYHSHLTHRTWGADRLCLRPSGASISATISSMFQSLSVTPAAIAGAIFSVLWMPQKL
jgi:hypothetical protein